MVSMLRKSLAIVSTIRIEPFIFLYMMCGSISVVTRSQLIQDKICMNNYNKSREFCIEINQNSNEEDQDTIGKILGDVSETSIPFTILSTLPCIIYVLFVGPWIDNYAPGRKIILLLGASAYIGQFLVLWLNSYMFHWGNYYQLDDFSLKLS